jgi:ATP/maltotriose-dependent transcriptional regulator MalT
MYEARCRGSGDAQDWFDRADFVEPVYGPVPALAKSRHTGLGRAVKETLRLADRTRVVLFRAWGSALHADFPAASLTLSEIHQTTPDLASGSRARISADLLEAFLHLCSDKGSFAYRCAKSIQSRTNEPTTLYAAVVFSRISCWLVGDLSTFVGIGRRTPPGNPSHRTSLFTLMDRSVEAAIEMRQLRLPMAARLSRFVIGATTFSTRSAEITLIPRLVLAQLAYEYGDFVEADSSVRAVLPRIRFTFAADTAIAAYLTLARSAVRRGQREFAGVMLQEGEGLGRERNWPRLSAACLGEAIDDLIALGRIDEAAVVFDRF